MLNRTLVFIKLGGQKEVRTIRRTMRFPIESIQHKPEGIYTQEHRFFSSIQQLPRWLLHRRWTQRAIIDFSTKGEVTANFTLEIGDFEFFSRGGGEDPRKADSPGAASRQPPGHRSSCLRRVGLAQIVSIPGVCRHTHLESDMVAGYLHGMDTRLVPRVPVGRWFISHSPCALYLGQPVRTPTAVPGICRILECGRVDQRVSTPRWPSQGFPVTL